MVGDRVMWTRAKRVLITGCGGMLGQAMYQSFIARACRVAASDKAPNARWLTKLDIRDDNSLRAAFEDFAPDLVLNLAAETDLEFCERHPDVAEATNTVAAGRIAALAEQRGIVNVYISTAGVFDGAKEGLYTEADEPNPIMVYGATKLGGEKLVRANSKRHYVIRAGWMVGGGPGRDHKFVPKILEQIANGQRTIHAVDDKWGTPTYTHDFAANLRALLATEQYGTYHMACEGAGTRYDVACEIVRICGRDDVQVEPVASSFFSERYFAPRPRSEMMVNAKLRALGINQMRPWQAALAEYLKREYPALITQAAQRGPGWYPLREPMVSIIIVSWNGWRDLERCLASIVGSARRHDEVLVIDNASNDGTVERLRRDYPWVRLIANAENLGHTRGINQGFALAQSPFLLVLDADTEFPPDMIDGLLQFLIEHPEVDVVAPRTYNPDGGVQETARNLPRPINSLFGRQSVLTQLWPSNSFSRRYLAQDKLRSDQPYRVEQISAACMLIRASVLRDAGGFDEGFFGYWADTDWCFTLRDLGKQIYCLPRLSLVHHESNRRGKRKSPRRILLWHVSANRLFRKRFTAGPGDWRAWLGWLGLNLRMLVLLAVNPFLPATPNGTPTPASVRAPPPTLQQASHGEETA